MFENRMDTRPRASASIDLTHNADETIIRIEVEEPTEAMVRELVGAFFSLVKEEPYA